MFLCSCSRPPFPASIVHDFTISTKSTLCYAAFGDLQVVIKLQGAVSESYCHCDSGTFLWEGRCEAGARGISIGARSLEVTSKSGASQEQTPKNI